METFGLIPLKKDYKKAEKTVKKFVSHVPFFKPVQRYLWNIYIKYFAEKESRTTNALPSAEDLNLVAEEGIRALHQRSAIRDKEFLEANGRCMDNIVPGPSTIKQAGRGAFAARPLAKGSVITGSPLLIITDRSLLNMYGAIYSKKKGKQVRDPDDLIGQQLLLNYCMGHPESTMLLCPYASGVNYMNHNQTQANVKIVWAQDGMLSHNASFLHLRPQDMEDNYKTSLAIDYIALQDIEPGQELFLDYGDDFEDAWIEHVENWEPQDEDYVDAATFNEKHKDAVLRTQAEQKADPYPSNLAIMCHSNLQYKAWRDYRDEMEIPWASDETGNDCEILSRKVDENGDTVYKIKLTWEEKEDGEYVEYTKTRDGVPRNAITFVNQPYSTDIHLMNAFRHEIEFPDALFPRRWRNDRS